MDNKFFNFIKPLLSYIDRGDLFRKPFNWLYVGLACLNLLIPILVLFAGIEGKIFSLPFKYVMGFILILLGVCAAAWVGFQLWWDRSKKVLELTIEGNDFLSVPAFSHLIQTSGECVGLWFAIAGTWTALISAIFMGNELGSMLPSRYLMGGGFTAIFMCPVMGFLIIVFSRFVAEQCRALAAIANNTKK